MEKFIEKLKAFQEGIPFDVTKSDVRSVAELIVKKYRHKYADLFSNMTSIQNVSLPSLAVSWACDAIMKMQEPMAKGTVISNTYSYFVYSIIPSVISDHFREEKKNTFTDSIYRHISSDNEFVKKNQNKSYQSKFKSCWIGTRWSENLLTELPTFDGDFFSEFVVPPLHEVVSLDELRMCGPKLKNRYLTCRYTLGLLETDYKKSATFSSIYPVIQSEIYEFRGNVSYEKIREAEQGDEDSAYTPYEGCETFRFPIFEKELYTYFPEKRDRFILYQSLNKFSGQEIADLSREYVSDGLLEKSFEKSTAGAILQRNRETLERLGYTSKGAGERIIELLSQEFEKNSDD